MNQLQLNVHFLSDFRWNTSSDFVKIMIKSFTGWPLKNTLTLVRKSYINAIYSAANADAGNVTLDNISWS